MGSELRTAGEEDLFFLVEALHKTFLYLSECAEGPYYEGFAALSVDAMETYALEYLDTRKARTLILRQEGEDIGCIMGKIAPSQIGAADIGLVGWIGLCYVDEAHRGREQCAQLYGAMEAWFASKSIGTVELSYMAANESAKSAWERLGFEPLRVIATKSIGKGEA
ncbi:GNAT family N-acetyltransferase [Thiomicrolovo sp. ZZH C-3]